MNKFYTLTVGEDMEIVYRTPAKEYRLGGPSFEIDGKICGTIRGAKRVFAAERKDGWTEERYEGRLGENTIALVLRRRGGTPFVRWHFALAGAGRLTKRGGKDGLVYMRYACRGFRGKEVRLSEYNHQRYSFCLAEVPAFRDEKAVMGPILVQAAAGASALFAYEHGSQYPDRFLEFAKVRGGIQLRAVKGNYWHGQAVDGYETVWLQFGACDGNEEELAALYRAFWQDHILPGHPSRRPLLYYNTWNVQERTQLRTGTYHSCMTLARILEDVETAHRMGIDVFVIDTGWFTRGGDWQVRRDRFPDGLQSVAEKLHGYGMRLGLWINPSAAGLQSAALAEYGECVASYMGERTKPFPVWESEPCHGMCLASRYWEVLAANLIRLCKETGADYIKWDAVWQYGCTDGHHLHGTEENSLQERGECYSFFMERYLEKICDAILEECPQTILDFDITEEGRCVGLGWPVRGKYFLVNNGPNYHNYDLPDPQWTNIFVNPGPARTWICRAANNYGKWIPSHLFLCHYLPDPPQSSQRMNLGSLILGGNGIWGDLHALSEEDVALHAEVLGTYKQVAEDMARAAERIDGETASTLQKYEKVDPATGRGAIVLFGFCGRKSELTARIESPVSGNFRIFGDASCERRGGAWFVRARFDGADAAILFCL